MIARLIAVAALSAAATLAGCSTPSTVKGMTAQKVTVAHRASEPISISVVGGKATSSAGNSQIADADFRAALAQSILDAGLFPSVAEGRNGPYHLEAFIGNLAQPMIGFSLTVEMEVSYKLVDLKDNSKVWHESFRTTHTATTSDSMAFPTRLRLANEAAARKNIELALAAMGRLDLR